MAGSRSESGSEFETVGPATQKAYRLKLRAPRVRLPRTKAKGNIH